MPLQMMAAAALCMTLPGYSQTNSASADQLLNQAIDAQQRGDYPVAIRDYRTVLELRSKDVEARVNLGAALVHTGHFDEGIAEYKTALPSVAIKDPVLLDLGLAYYKKGDMKNALEQFDILHRSQPGNVRVTILLAYTEINTAHADAAVALLSPLESANSANLEFEYVLGSALIKDGARTEGVTRLEKVAEASHNADAYRLAGSTLLDMNDDYERARHDLDAALAIDPKQPGLYTLAGNARVKSGDLAGAEEAFRTALKLNPDDVDANLYLGAILYKRRDTDEARGYLERALRLNPKSSMAVYEMAMLKSTTGQLEAAVSDLEKVTLTDPDWLEPHIALASLYFRLHRSDDGTKQREIVDRLTAAQQAKGPGKH
ncbi:MAG TPA: tetratricopeptide repeat protein [Acidisarcina sp.]